VLVQALRPKLAVEGLDERILHSNTTPRSVLLSVSLSPGASVAFVAAAVPTPCKADKHASRSRPNPPAGAAHGSGDNRNARAFQRSPASASSGRPDPRGVHDSGSSIAPPEARCTPVGY
jgi:hypothetical protein